VIGGEPPLELLWRRNDDGHIALHHRLAGKGVPGRQIRLRQTKNAPAPHLTGLDPHRAPPATTLATAGLLDLDFAPAGGLGE